MNWEAFGAIGEVIGAVAVVVTLIFLILQLRLNTTALEENKNTLRVQASYERTRGQLDFHNLIIDSLYFAPIMTKINAADHLEQGIADLDPEELTRLMSIAMSSFIRLEHHMYLHREGYLDDDYYRFNSVTSVKQRYPLWKALGIIDGKLRSGRMIEINPATLKEIGRIVGDA